LNPRVAAIWNRPIEPGWQLRQGGRVVARVRPVPAGWQVINVEASSSRTVPTREAAQALADRIARLVAV
jgi:hypothetical protein